LERVTVNIPDNEYIVYIGSRLKKNIVNYLESCTENRNILIVTDDFFAKGYALEIVDFLEKKNFFVSIYIMQGGKFSKSFNEVLNIYGELEANNFARDSVLIALGGGVIGDLAGFVASTWYRGMNLLHIPTTLMAMVDSSIGGKVAINFRQTVNAVGNYYHPVANFMDIDFIDSLSDRDYISGLSEVIKCSFIADSEFTQYLINNRVRILDRDRVCLIFCIRRSIKIKVDHVRNDVKEGGKRLLLNYGHTLGHAIEMSTQTDKGEVFRHGEGVSLGISAALLIAQLHLGLQSEVAKSARYLLESFNLPIYFSASDYGYKRSVLIKQCMKLILKDKKRKDNKLRLILVDTLGHAEVYTDISNKLIKEAFENIIKD
jgi:3-dehydroquinate synthase